MEGLNGGGDKRWVGVLGARENGGRKWTKGKTMAGICQDLGVWDEWVHTLRRVVMAKVAIFRLGSEMSDSMSMLQVVTASGCVVATWCVAQGGWGLLGREGVIQARVGCRGVTVVSWQTIPAPQTRIGLCLGGLSSYAFSPPPIVLLLIGSIPLVQRIYLGRCPACSCPHVPPRLFRGLFCVVQQPIISRA